MFQSSYTGISNIPRTSLFFGGMCNWYYIPVEAIDIWPAVDPATQYLTAKPTIKPGYGWFGPVTAANRQLTFTETPKFSTAGFYYEWKVTGKVPGYHPVLMQNLAYHRFIVLGIPRSLTGKYIIIGTKHSPLRYVHDMNLGRHWTEDTSTKISFEGECKHKALILPFTDEELANGPDLGPVMMFTETGQAIVTEDGQTITF